MKKLSLLFLTYLAFNLSHAQTIATTVEYQKVNRPALANDIPFPEKTVRDAIDSKLQSLGYKGKESKGFTIYKGVHLSELGEGNYDLYYSADRKTRKEKENCVLTLMISKGFDSFVADSTDANLVNKAKDYLNNIRDMIAAYDLELQIQAQDDATKKAGKKYNNAVSDGENMQKKLRKLLQDIEDNKKDQANLKTEEDKQKQILETLKEKRKH